MIAMPDAVELELYQHVVWLCENRCPATWDSIKALASQLGRIAGMSGKGTGRRRLGTLLFFLSWRS